MYVARSFANTAGLGVALVATDQVKRANKRDARVKQGRPARGYEKSAHPWPGRLIATGWVLFFLLGWASPVVGTPAVCLLVVGYVWRGRVARRYDRAAKK